MKKILIIIFFVISFVVSKTQDFNGGVFTGFSASQIDGDTYAGYDKLGLVGGAFVNRDLSQRYNLQFEMLYIQKGARKNQNPDAGDYSIHVVDLKYVELPLLIKYKLYKFNERVSFEFGLSAAVLIKSTRKDEHGKTSITNPYKKSDFCTNIGVNYEIIDNLSINLRYSYSLFFTPILSSVNKTRWMIPWTQYIFSQGQYNNILAFTLRYQFRNKTQKESP